MLTRLKRFIFSYDWEIVEIQGAVFKVCWAVWLLMPFPVFRNISGYTSVASENIWGVSLLLLGSLHLFSVLHHNRNMRRVMTGISFLFWLFTVALVWIQSHTSPLLVFFAIIALFMFFNFLRLFVPSVIIIENMRKEDVGRPEGDRRVDAIK